LANVLFFQCTKIAKSCGVVTMYSAAAPFLGRRDVIVLGLTRMMVIGNTSSHGLNIARVWEGQK